MKLIRSFLFILALGYLLVACTNVPNNNDGLNDEENESVPSGVENENNDRQPENEENNLNGENEPSGEATANEAKDEADMKELLASLGFTKIEIEIEYNNNQEFEVKIEERRDGTIKVEVEDEINNIDIEDNLQAFNHIFPFVKQLNITQGTPQEEAISEILRVFDMSDDYTEFEAEFTFSDGASIEYKDK